MAAKANGLYKWLYLEILINYIPLGLGRRHIYYTIQRRVKARHLRKVNLDG
jgi:hypothetical protein